MLPRSALTLVLAALACPAGVLAQTSPSETDAPAHVSRVEGAVSLEREGRPENAPLNMPLLSGDRLKTLEGRAEVLFGDGSSLHVDSRTTVDMQSDELMRLIDGRLRLNMVGPARNITFRIDSPAGSVRVRQPGEYRVSLLRRQEEVQLELAVIRGGGEIFTDEGTTEVRAGERAYASAGLMPSYAYSYNSATWDEFDRWTESLRSTRLGASSQYLPEEVRPYTSTFDEYGDWRYQQTHGYVWYPRVAATWRPYYYGRWATYPRYGWTWIGADTFAWPTHHYGRWGFSAGAWFWIPSARWAPAYVSWGYAPGYVSWCPLGWDNRPVIGIDVFRVGPGYYSAAHAWTLVPYSHFGNNYYVHHRAVDWRRFNGTNRPRIEHRPTAPGYRDVAVPRNTAPILRAGTRGGSSEVPRAVTTTAPGRERQRVVPSSAADAPRYINRGNEIVQSRTERPTSPASAPRAVPRNGDNRNFAPPENGDSPRFAQPAVTPRVTENGDSRNSRTAPAPGNEGSPRFGQQARPRNGDSPHFEAPRAEPRGESPAYRPRYEPRFEPAPQPAPSAQPAPAITRPAARERPAPTPPPQRSAPANDPSPPAAGGERAVPRETPREAPRAGGSAGVARPRGGRGGGV